MARRQTEPKDHRPGTGCCRLVYPELMHGVLRSVTSRPLDKPASGRIAVKVIIHLGDEGLEGLI
jgi:hypothetical protein